MAYWHFCQPRCCLLLSLDTSCASLHPKCGADQWCLSTLDAATEQGLEKPAPQRCCDQSCPSGPAFQLLAWLFKVWAMKLAMVGKFCFPKEILVSSSLLIDLLIALISYWLHLCCVKDREVMWYWVMWLGSSYWDLEWRCCLKQQLCNLGCSLSREWWWCFRVIQECHLCDPTYCKVV